MKAWEIWGFVLLLWIVGANFIHLGLISAHGDYYPQPQAAFYAGIFSIGVSILLLWAGGFIKAESKFTPRAKDRAIIICGYCRKSFLSLGLGSDAKGMTINCPHCGKTIHQRTPMPRHEGIILQFTSWKYKDIVIVALSATSFFLLLSLLNLRLLPWLQNFIGGVPLYLHLIELSPLLFIEGLLSVITSMMFLVGPYFLQLYQIHVPFLLIPLSLQRKLILNPKPPVRFSLALMITGIALIGQYFFIK